MHLLIPTIALLGLNVYSNGTGKPGMIVKSYLDSHIC